MRKILFILLFLLALWLIHERHQTMEVSEPFYKVTGHSVEDTAHVISINSVKFD